MENNLIVKRPVGRPKKRKFPIMDEKNLSKLKNVIACGSTKEGIRMLFDLSNDDFYDKFMHLPEVQEMFEKGKELRNTMIRMKQMQVAMDGNVPMLIHLGKTELGQTEKTESVFDLTHKIKASESDEEIINEFLARNGK